MWALDRFQKVAASARGMQMENMASGAAQY